MLGRHRCWSICATSIRPPRSRGRPSPIIRSGDDHAAADHGIARDGALRRRSRAIDGVLRSEEHTSELQSLMRISYAVFCLKKKKKQHHDIQTTITTKNTIQTK